MTKKYEEIVFTIKKGETREDLYKKVSQQLQLLMGEGYICVVRDDDTDIIVIEYAHNDYIDAWGGAMPEWLSYEEREKLEMMREECEECVDPDDSYHFDCFEQDESDCKNDTYGLNNYTGYYCTAKTEDECPQYTDCFDCPKCEANKKS